MRVHEMSPSTNHWIPAFAGMTNAVVPARLVVEHGRANRSTGVDALEQIQIASMTSDF
jgi:hypothetical protein